MDARLLRRVACPTTTMTSTAATARRACSLLSTSSSSTSSSISSSLIPHNTRIADRRYQSTANRTKRALNIAPHASFLKGGGGREKAGAGSGSGSSTQVAGTIGTIENSSTTVLYNPPASAPSVYQTPFKFLPKSDPRRRQNLTSLFSRTSSSSSSTAADPTSPVLPHSNYQPAAKAYHLTQEDVAEIRRLRQLDPIEWSVHRIAHHFECSPVFVMMVVRSSQEHQQAVRARVEAARSRWGPIRTKARVDRVKRREMLYSGQL